MNDASELAKAVEALLEGGGPYNMDHNVHGWCLWCSADDNQPHADNCEWVEAREALAAYRAAGEDPWLPCPHCNGTGRAEGAEND